MCRAGMVMALLVTSWAAQFRKGAAVDGAFERRDRRVGHESREHHPGVLRLLTRPRSRSSHSRGRRIPGQPGKFKNPFFQHHPTSETSAAWQVCCGRCGPG